MKRTNITENGERNGKWFDAENAGLFKEDSWHDGQNWISYATSSQWGHESIYVTKAGVFILNHWSNFQGTHETYEIISKAKAAEWFVRNNYKDEEIPAQFQESIANLEVK